MKQLFNCKRKLSALLALGFLVLPGLVYSNEEAVADVVPSVVEVVQHQEPLLEATAAVIENVHDEVKCRATGRKSIMIRPEMLSAADLARVLRAVVEDAVANNEELPQAVITCYEAIANGEGTVCAQDLLEAIPVLVEKMAAMVEGRAPRPGGVPPIAGGLIGCDLTEVLRELNNLSEQLAACCAEIDADFDFTFSILNNLVITFSTLIDIVETLSLANFVDIAITLSNIDINVIEVLNTLTECCADISDNFIGTFTTLTSINNTLTACCASIATNFAGTFTSLTSLNTTLTDCCASIATNFVGTFTSLTALQTSVDTCCTTLNANIGQQSDNPPLFDSLPSSTDTYITTTFNTIEWLKAIYVRLGQLAGY